MRAQRSNKQPNYRPEGASGAPLIGAADGEVRAEVRDERAPEASAASESEVVFQALNVMVQYTMIRRKATMTVPAIDDVTFDVVANSLVSVIGPSGCGKSTLLKAIAGLVPCARGELSLGGHLIVGPGPDRAVVFQSPALLPWRSALRNASYGLELHGVDRRAAEGMARGALELVGLGGMEARYPHELSGGMQQRVNLARALVVEPILLLLDEPFSALDEQTREVMGVELLRILEETRTTALFVTHQIAESVFLSDRIVVLSKGPGTVVRIVEVDLPRPRTEKVRKMSRFHELIHEIRSFVFS